MKKIPLVLKPNMTNLPNIKSLKDLTPVIKSSKLERTPIKEFFDYSTEELGYFTRRDSKGNILEIFQTIFPR